MKRIMLITVIAIAAINGACTLSQQQTIDNQLFAVNQTVTAVETGTDQALNAHLITPAQAQAVSTIVHQVNPLIDAARAAETANDPASANKTLNLINTLLAGLQAYVPKPATN